ncbi:MAG TPA: PilZ domain-containing protein [Xanthobacteraceae bacterium]|nr:PilZ domain-containing protein [Xanthobacteraceae bacterium]
MLEVVTSATAVPCPMCGKDMVLAVIMPHPAAPQLAKHTYHCDNCDQTKTYTLQVAPEADTTGVNGDPDPATAEPEDRRKEPREALTAPASIYDKDGNFLWPCSVRDLSKSGARLELFNEATLPQYVLLSMSPDGSDRRLCSKVWQLALIAGVRFTEKQT